MALFCRDFLSNDGNFSFYPCHFFDVSSMMAHRIINNDITVETKRSTLPTFIDDFVMSMHRVVVGNVLFVPREIL